MLSLDNAFNDEDMGEFNRRLLDRLGDGDQTLEYACEPKLDGIAVSLLYRDGVLERVQAPEGDFSLDASAPSGWRRSEMGTPRVSLVKKYGYQ